MLPQLNPTLCRLRQDRLRALLAEKGLEAAVLTNRHYVHALTGYWHAQPLTSVAIVLRREGPTTLVAPEDSLAAPAADEYVPYTAQKLATIVEDVEGSMWAAVYPLLRGCVSLAAIGPYPAHGRLECVDISADYQYLRRKKDEDEVALLRFAIGVTERVFGKAKALLASHPTEVDMYAAMYAKALREVGEPLSGWGNDFRSGSPGGLPRRRRVESGELAVYDVGIGVRGYRSDLCRTFVVDANPTVSQRKAHARILEAFEQIEDRLAPDLSCRGLFYEIDRMLNGWNGLAFTHHLGHGIGLDAHEVPRLNPEWDDVLQVGDVVAVEPALYDDELRAGIRLEQNYLITESGAERLSSFPLDL